VGAITEWSVFSLLAVAQPVITALLYCKSNWFLLNLEVSKLMSAIAEWLGFRLATEAPRIFFSYK
jgi:hypothetical protein